MVKQSYDGEHDKWKDDLKERLLRLTKTGQFSLSEIARAIGLKSGRNLSMFISKGHLGPENLRKLERHLNRIEAGQVVSEASVQGIPVQRLDWEVSKMMEFSQVAAEQKQPGLIATMRQLRERRYDLLREIEHIDAECRSLFERCGLKYDE